MEQGFIDSIEKMVRDYGKDILFDIRKVKSMLTDFTRNQFKKETNLLKQLLDANCAKIVSEANNLKEVKTMLVKRLEDDYGLSPKVTSELLDLLGLVLRGDRAKTVIEQPPIAMKTTEDYLVSAYFLVYSDCYERAFEEYDLAIKSEPEWYLSYFLRAQAAAKISEYDLAITDCTKAINIYQLKKSKNTTPLYHLFFLRGRTYIHKGEYSKAIKDLEYVIQISNDEKTISLVYAYLGASYYAVEQNSDAIKACTKAIEKDEKQYWAYWWSGKAFFDTKKFKNAHNAFSMCITLNPNDDDARAYINEINSLITEKG